MAEHHHYPPPPRPEALRLQPRRSRDTEFTRDILMVVFVLVALTSAVAVAVVVASRVPGLGPFLHAVLPGA